MKKRATGIKFLNREPVPPHSVFLVKQGLFNHFIRGIGPFVFLFRGFVMASSFFSFKSFRWVALLALLGASFQGATAKAAVVSIDLTGYTGDNAGASVGGFRQISPFVASPTRLMIFNQYNSSGLYTGLSVAGASGTYGVASTGDSGSDTPLKFGAGATIDGSVVYGQSYSATVFSNPIRGAVGDYGPSSYIGFRTDAGQYGYIEVTWTASTSTFRMISAAYESTAGVAIQTPSAPVPEPASAMIASLFLGGAAFKRWRSKRA